MFKKLAFIALVFSACAHAPMTKRQVAGMKVIKSTDVAINDPRDQAFMVSTIQGATTLQRDEVLVNEEGEAGMVVILLKDDNKKVLGSLIYLLACNEQEDYCHPVSDPVLSVRK